MKYAHKDGMIYDPEDGQTIAAMSESATPEQAKLLAAAPDLLAEGQTLIERLKEMAIHPSHYAGLQAAITKATQEQK